jgi:hypothetical protein
MISLKSGAGRKAKGDIYTIFESYICKPPSIKIYIA